MATKSNVEVTISLVDLGLDDEDLQEQVEILLPQLKEVDGVEDANLVPVENAPKGTKSISGFVWGLIKAKAANIPALFKFLSDRFGNKPIKIGVKAPDGRELTVEASSREEFEFALQKAQDFLNNKSNG
ncbi:sugar ABC transporter permease [Nostoc sp. CENA67]|uniref:Sugar ABC transporter permease n=1 Tax=Amazonocrinis nigriterrae CENA67 TaxID=2794033 RepID=A0A8J7HQH3_9NOST|nr:sugar ABC transporter permease [Amazonocrinis nigriterrae]MBH8564086.1 sugar ABC transporter permease [Amazonocrinis nigriterrae CENA67]